MTKYLVYASLGRYQGIDHSSASRMVVVLSPSRSKLVVVVRAQEEAEGRWDVDRDAR